MGVGVAKNVSRFSKDPASALSWTTDEKILLSKLNLVGLDLKEMLKKYYGASFSVSYHTSNNIINTKDVFFNSIDWDVFNINGKSYQATLDNLKQNIFPDLNTNVTDALTKILKGEGVIQPAPVTIQQVVSTTPINTIGTVSTTPINVSTSNTLNMGTQVNKSELDMVSSIAQLTPAQKDAVTLAVAKGADESTAIAAAKLTKSQADALNTVAKANGSSLVFTATETTPPPTQPITAVATTPDYTKYYLIGGGVLILAIGAVLILKK